MDKKTKKRLEVLRKKKTDLEQRIAGAREQPDDPDELAQYESQLAAVMAEIKKLKGE